jgi:hypothetical protein
MGRRAVSKQCWRKTWRLKPTNCTELRHLTTQPVQSCLQKEDNTEFGNSDNAFARFSSPLYAILTYKGRGTIDFFSNLSQKFEKNSGSTIYSQP